MKVALVYPLSQELNLKGYPLGLAYLSASFKRKHQVTIYDYNGEGFNKNLNSFFAAVEYSKPDLAGISFNSFNRWGAYKIINRVKRINKGIRVVLGGFHPSTMYRQVFKVFLRRHRFCYSVGRRRAAF